MKKKILKSIGLFFGLIILVIVAYVIFVFSSYYRIEDKQILEIKGEINKIPNKISIISVVFVLPLILILILGPFLINFLS
mgnify:CR=1 FL=1